MVVDFFVGYGGNSDGGFFFPYGLCFFIVLEMFS